MTKEEARIILGPGDLKEAYRRAAFKAHPDRGGNVEDFIRVTKAYELLRVKGFRKKVSEAAFQDAVIKAIVDRGGFVFNICGGPMQAAGMPDLYVASHLWTGWLELKVGKNKPSPIQRDKLKKLRRQKVSAMVLRYYKGLIFEDHEGKVLLETEWVKDGEAILQACIKATDGL